MSGIPIELSPVPLHRENVSAFAAITKKTVNIPDVYDATGFDFTGPKKYDASTGYRSHSMLVVPMKNPRTEVMRVLQLINAVQPETGRTVSFYKDATKFVESLASQAAVTITSMMMVTESEDLFNSLVKVMATAIDEKSPYSGGHIQRVAQMALELARLVNEEKGGPLAVLRFTEEQLHEIYIAGLMHDMGKVGTPEWIMDKATRLEKIFDRIHLVRERFLKIMNALKAEKLEQRIPMWDRGIAQEEIERYEGEMNARISGLKGDQLPIQARILALVDIFEALTAKDRPYKKPLPLETALKILEAEVEAKHLDKNIYNLFLKTKFHERMM